MEKKRILIVDDESGVRESFRMVFKDTYDVVMADCGRTGLEMIKQLTPELVFLDVRLPDMDGIDVLREVKQINGSIPVIVITGAGTHKTAIDALKLGADDFVAKPINFYYVRTTVTNCLNRKKEGSTAAPTAEDVITKHYLSTLKMLNKILEARDPYTREHSQKVSEYAVEIAQQLGLSEDEQEVMRQTALLHDIGKVGVPEAILNKQSALNPQEWAEIRKHAQIGEEFLEPLKLLHIEQSIVRHHHERYDGKGYPDRLKADEIPLYARILAVADAYEAMTHARPYRGAISPVEAISELERCSGKQFDPKVVQALVDVLKKRRI
ncbi:HD domain-containing phosphohydrolase [Candidatus Omnitrophota bacterium]